MPGLVPGIHVLIPLKSKDVDGRVKPGHDGGKVPDMVCLAVNRIRIQSTIVQRKSFADRLASTNTRKYR
jgi:hypothetical protein